MAGVRGRRLNREHDELTRSKIKTSQIINRLVNHILGAVEMTNTQVRAAEILLNKTLPNLQHRTGDQDVTVTYVDYLAALEDTKPKVIVPPAEVETEPSTVRPRHLDS